MIESEIGAAHQEAQIIDRAFEERQDLTHPRADLIDILHSNEQGKVLPKIEYMHIDTRTDKNDSSMPQVVLATGALGTGLDVEPEVITWALVAGEKGLLADFVSLPGHGETGNPKDGWDQPGDFEASAQTIAHHVREIKRDDPDRKIILQGWSMGGVPIIKAALLVPELIDGIILVDTPVSPDKFLSTAARFALYGYGARKVEKEPPLQLSTKLTDILTFFKKRWQTRNMPKGIPLKDVALPSARSLMKVDLFLDGTVKDIAESGIPILLLRGSNDFLIRSGQLERLVETIKEAGGNIQDTVIQGAGHMLMQERPRDTAKQIKQWMDRILHQKAA